MLCQQCINNKNCEIYKQIQELNSKTVQVKKIDCKNYKSEWNERVYHKVNRYFPSSQLCNICGYKNEDTKNLGVRFWECPECNSTHDRDKNASINILNQGLKDMKI